MVLEADPGDVVFFHYFTLHGSKQNVSNRIRKTVLTQLYAGDDRVEDFSSPIIKPLFALELGASP